MKAKRVSPKLSSNIWKHGIHLITNKRLYMSVLGVYLLTVPNATAQTIGLMNLVGSIAGFIFEVPSGYLADKFGHKRAMVLARLAMLLSSVCYVIGSRIPVFLFAAVLLNIGQAFQSGTAAALMHETLTELKRDNEYSKIMGRLSSIGFAIPIIPIVLIPFTVSIDFRLPFIVVAVVDLIGLIAVLSYVEPIRTHIQIKEISNTHFFDVITEGYRLGVFKYLVYMAMMSSLLISAAIYKDAYQSFLGVPIMYYGIFWGISRAIISLTLLVNGSITKICSFNTFLAMKYLVFISLLLGLAIATSPYVIVGCFVLLSSFSWSFSAANSHYLLQIIGKSKFKATLISLRSLLENVFMAGASFYIGVLITKYSYNSAYIQVAIFSATILGLQLLFIMYKSRSQKA